jgi:hypothetical protein
MLPRNLFSISYILKLVSLSLMYLLWCSSLAKNSHRHVHPNRYFAVEIFCIRFAEKCNFLLSAFKIHLADTKKPGSGSSKKKLSGTSGSGIGSYPAIVHKILTNFLKWTKVENNFHSTFCFCVTFKLLESLVVN